MSKTVNRIKNTSRRIIDGDEQVWTDIKQFFGARVKRQVAQRKSKFKQIADQQITTYKVSKYQPPKYGISALADPEYYSEQSGQTFDSVSDALAHYKNDGAAKGLSPHRLFDPVHYLAQMDIAPEGITPLEHYFEIGGAEGLSPSPYFDSAYYLRTYHWTRSHNPLAHYLCFGVKENHNPFGLFDSSHYVRTAIENGSTHRSPIEHYMSQGWREGHNPHPLVDLDYLGSQIRPGSTRADWKMDPLLIYRRDAKVKSLSPHPLFDPDFYMAGLQDMGIAVSGEESVFTQEHFETPLDYFLSADAPIANPSREFSAQQYKFKYPDLGAMNGLYHYVRYGQHEGRIAYPSMSSALNADLLRQMDNEPTLLAPHQPVKDMFVAFMPRQTEPGLDMMQALLEVSTDFAPDIVYCLPQFFRGGAEKYGSKLVNTLVKEAPDRKILVIETDGVNTDSRDWYKDGPNVKYIALGTKDSRELRANTLARYITLMRPKWVINNNSHACWEAYEKYGVSMTINSKLAACLFCYDIDVNGSRVGYARDYVRDTISDVNVFLVDNQSFCKTLADDFSLDPGHLKKLKNLYQPFEMDGSDAAIKAVWPKLAETTQKPRILWPSRFHVQKRPDLLREIVMSLPDIEFMVWSPDGWNKKLAGGDMPNNVIHTSEETTFADVAQRGVSGMLLNSAWEGLPTVLVESVTAGLPIIANNVGGVGEIVSDKTGYLVDVDAPASAYSDAIVALIGNPSAAAKKRNAAFKAVKEQHSYAAYVARLKSIGIL